MSRLIEVVKELEVEAGFKKQEEEVKVMISTRVTEEEAWRIDFLAKRVCLSRAGLCQILLKEACIDAAEALGFPFAELQALYLSEKSGKPIEEVKEMLSKSGIFVTSKNGEQINITGIVSAVNGGK